MITTRRTRHHREVPDYNRQFTRVGIVMLLLAAFSLVGYFTPEGKYREWIAILNSPEPRDCDWSASPMGAKHCHYESVVSHTRTSRGDEVRVTWHRVND